MYITVYISLVILNLMQFLMKTWRKWDCCRVKLSIYFRCSNAIIKQWLCEPLLATLALSEGEDCKERIKAEGREGKRGTQWYIPVNCPTKLMLLLLSDTNNTEVCLSLTIGLLGNCHTIRANCSFLDNNNNNS